MQRIQERPVMPWTRTDLQLSLRAKKRERQSPRSYKDWAKQCLALRDKWVLSFLYYDDNIVIYYCCYGLCMAFIYGTYMAHIYGPYDGLLWRFSSLKPPCEALVERFLATGSQSQRDVHWPGRMWI